MTDCIYIPILVFYCLYVYQKRGNHRQDKYRFTMETTFVNQKSVINWNVHCKMHVMNVFVFLRLSWNLLFIHLSGFNANDMS